MKILLPILLIVSLVLLSCTEKNDHSTSVSTTESTFIQPSQVKEEKQTASLLPEVRSTPINAPQITEARKEEIMKTLSLQEIFLKNMIFTENKGQLEKWHQLRIEKIGAIKFYTQAFGGTAYFGKNGIGIGFYKDQLNDLYHKSASAADLEEEEEEEYHHKKKETFFLYIDHEGSNKNVSVEGWNPKEGKINYFKGKESEFITDITNYEGVVYKDLYPNIDLKYSFKDALIYDYIVRPKGKVSDIRKKFSGVNSLKINSKGELEVHTAWGILTDKKIYAYQIIAGRQKEVTVRYKKLSATTVGYQVLGKYDESKELIIDPPTLTFATWMTRSGANGYINDIAVDAAGNIYATGWSNGIFNLATPFDNVVAAEEAIVMKLKSDGTTLLYASFLGGDGGGAQADVGFGIAVNSASQAYVVGFTNNATNFPTAGTPIQAGIAGGIDIFATKVNAAGNGLVYSTFYGGTGDDRAFGVAVNASDEAFITGWTTSAAGFSTAGAFQTAKGVGGAFGYDAYVLKISDPTAGTVVKNYCTYFGGTNEDMGRAIAVNGGDVFITGVTQSTGLSTVGNTFGGGGGGGAFDAFITRINGATGNNRVYCAYVGGDFDEKGEGIAVSSTNEAYITGWTKSILRGTVAAPNPGAFPVKNAITGYTQNANPGGNIRDAFMTRVSATGVILNSTFMGVVGDDNVKNGNAFDQTVQHRSGSIAVNSNGNVAVAMSTDGAGATLPLVSSVYSTPSGGSVGLADAYLFVLAPDAQTLQFTSFYGGDGNDYPTAGIKFDPSDCLIIGGGSHSATLPTTAGVVNTARLAGVANDEYYIAKFCAIILPVELLYFEAHQETTHTVLEWSTVSEKNNDYFIVERSSDGINFTAIGTIKGAGNSSGLLNYSLTDSEVTTSTVYYRLKQVDFDAVHSYSKIVVVDQGRPQTISIHAIGLNTYSVSKNFVFSGNIEMRVLDAQGKTVYEFQEAAGAGLFQKTIDLNRLASGLYVIQATSGEEKKSEKVVVNY